MLEIFGILAAILLFQKKYSFPVVNPVITSPFGWRNNPLTNQNEFHNGIDIISNDGNLFIYAPGDGTVIDVYSNSAGGNQLLLQCKNIVFGFAHLKDIYVVHGATVSINDCIAQMGATGEATGIHLHFTAIKDNVHINPLSLSWKY